MGRKEKVLHPIGVIEANNLRYDRERWVVNYDAILVVLLILIIATRVEWAHNF